MLKNLIGCLFFCIISLVAHSQNQAAKAEDYSFVERKVFTNFRSALQYGNIPSFKVQRKNQQGEWTYYETTTVTTVSLFGMSYEPRVNLVDFSDKASFSISTPMDFNLSLAYSTPNDLVSTGFFSASAGLFGDFNVGNHSTYNNISRKGFTISVGMRFHKAPFFRIPEGEYKFSKISAGPALRVMFKDDMRNGKNRILYFEMGVPKRIVEEGIKTDVFGNAIVILGVGRILNY